MHSCVSYSWEGPYYPNRTSTWDTWSTIQQCTTATKVKMLIAKAMLLCHIVAGLGPLNRPTHSARIPSPVFIQRACLFNIFNDPTEHHDLADKEPEVVTELLERMKKAQLTLFDPNRGSSDPVACEAVFQRYQGFWGPWLP